jgi:cardiolipin synthase
MTIPNLITIARLILVPLVIASIGSGNWQIAFVLFAVAGISDGVDGFIARRFNMRSELGAYLDPLADKALLVSIYVALAVFNVLPGWLAILVVSRDLMIVSAIMLSWLMDRRLEIRLLTVSKMNTAAQITFAGLVPDRGFGIPLAGWARWHAVVAVLPLVGRRLFVSWAAPMAALTAARRPCRAPRPTRPPGRSPGHPGSWLVTIERADRLQLSAGAGRRRAAQICVRAGFSGRLLDLAGDEVH